MKSHNNKSISAFTSSASLLAETNLGNVVLLLKWENVARENESAQEKIQYELLCFSGTGEGPWRQVYNK